LAFGSSCEPSRNRDFNQGKRHPEDFSPDQPLGKRNLGSSKAKQGSRRGGGGREGRLQQCVSTETFAYDGRNPKLEVFQGSERDLYVDSRFNVYYIPKGAEFLEGRVYRSRSDDTLSHGSSAHRNRMPVEDDDDDDDVYEDYKCTTLKNKKEMRARGLVSHSTQSVTHRAQIEPRPPASNDFDETNGSKSFINENGTFFDKNGVYPNEKRYFPPENGAFPKEGGVFQRESGPSRRDSGSLLTPIQLPQDEEFLNPLSRRSKCSFEDFQQFQETVKSPGGSAGQDRPESVSFYDIEHIPSSKPSIRNNQMWNAMKPRQPLSLYLTCTYDGLDPTSNTTSV